MFAIRTMNRPLRSLGAAIAVLQLAGVGAVAAGQVEPHMLQTEAAAPATPAAGAAPDGRVAASAVERATEAVIPLTTTSTTSTTTTAVTSTSTSVAAPPPPPAAPPAAAPAAPPPAPAPRAAAPPAPAPTPPPPAPKQQDPAARVQSTYQATVPGAWRGAIQVRFEIIEGNTSWASPNGVIQVARAHAEGSDRLLRALLAHEFGHLVAFRYGSYEYNGAAPEGWPAYSSRPEEAWADCVSRVFTGIDDPSHGLPSCAGESLSWTSRWLGAGPGAHERTG